MKAGVVTNANKGVDAGVTVAGMLFGTRELYRFADRNADLRLVPSSVTHGILSLARLQKFTSINSALEVDLTGQVNAEAIGADHIGAVGGQVDFIRGSALSSGGVSIIALPSTGKDGRSRIVNRLSGPVTTARSDVDFVATEHGVARLRGKSLRERMRALVEVAAPEHREGLMRDAGC
jgi:acyl-CoA hydrolase